MKKFLVILFVLAIAALSVMSVCSAPRERYYDQMGNKYWCNVDSDGCWVTGEEGEHIYIMFWSAASAAKFMGADSNAPLGIHPGTAELPLLPPARNCLGEEVCNERYNLATASCKQHVANYRRDGSAPCTVWDACTCQCYCDGKWGIWDTYP